MSADTATVAAGPWLNADEAWGYMRLTSRKALYHLVRRGQIPAHRLGKRRLRFHRVELDQFLAAAPAFRR